MSKKLWIHSASFDLGWIIAPAFLATALVLFFPKVFNQSELPIWSWVAFVLLIDVAHVYSTLFRTYFDREEFSSRRNLYVLVPLISFVGGVLVYTVSAELFWRCLAYIAVFHFIRQQYGFMMIYARKAQESGVSLLIDRLVIYLATLYPLIFWHTNLPREFSWFVQDDFFSLSGKWYSKPLEELVFAAWASVLVVYLTKELVALWRGGEISWGKQLLVLGTTLSWYVGIVLFNGDMAFTLTNVIAHGVPYIALIWIYGRRKAGLSVKSFFALRYLPVFIAVLFGLAYVEEGLWHALVWRENFEIFKPWFFLPQLTSKEALSLIVPLLTLPQLTHYILDGFIWRMRNEDRDLSLLVNSSAGRG